MTLGHLASAPPGGSTSHRPEDLIRAAHVVLQGCGVEMRPQRVTRLVRTFREQVERNGFSFFDFLANAVAVDADARRRALANPDVQRVISWADPTGETAIANVMRERGR